MLVPFFYLSRNIRARPSYRRLRIIKVEAVYPCGLVSALLNNYFVSLLFFRRYLFDEAKAMRDTLSGKKA